MKKISSLIAIFLLCAVSLFAQVPEKFTYQAVVRNASNALVANAQVGVRVSILQGSASGNAVYVEAHSATTNANGLVTVNIGGGTVQQGIFSDINWANGPFFLKTETDPNGGNDYSITSTQQLLSVPYALYARDAGNGFSGDYNDLVNVPQIPQIPADVSAFNNDAGYITGYTETDPQYNAWDKDYNDLINKPTIPTLPTNISAFTNDAGYITLSQVPSQVNADWNATTGAALILNKPTLFSGNYNDLTNKPTLFDGNYNSLSNKPNLAAVALSGSYNDLINKPSIPTAVGELTNNVGYITLSQVPVQVNADWNATTGAALILNKPTIPTVPTNVSAFTNDAGYITSAAIPTVPTNVSTFTNDAGYITAAEVQQAAGVPTVVSAFQNDAGYLTAYTEQQVLSISNDTIFLTGGSFVKLPTGFSGSWNDLTDKPENISVPDSVSAFVNDAGYITAAQCGNVDICALNDYINTLQQQVAVLQYNINTMYNSIVGVPASDGQPCFGTPTVTDYDGNVYNTVQVGTQCWMKENLRTTHHADGTAIALGLEPSTSIAYRFYPNNDSNNVTMYGYLYNRTAVMHGEPASSSNPSGVQGICPTGWHVTSYQEWVQLMNYVTGLTAYLCNPNLGYMTKALSAQEGWNYSSENCTPGNAQEANNATGFTARPAGVYQNGNFLGFGSYALFATATEYSTSQYWRVGILYDLGCFSSDAWRNNVLVSVRCIKD